MIYGFPGDKLTDAECDEILQDTGTEEDLEGNVKFHGEWFTLT